MLGIIDFARNRIARKTAGLFAHAPYPLEHTLDYTGDAGLFGPDSVTWRVIGDVATLVGGIRALLVQAAHQEVAAGVADHSRYQDDPLGRLSRTSAYVTATAFGALPEVDQAILTVRRAHRPVRGESHRLRAYAADDPGHAAWVHNVLADSFLAAHQRYGKDKLDERNADRFVAEQVAVGRLLDANPLPRTADVLSKWVEDHPDIGISPGMVNAVDSCGGRRSRCRYGSPIECCSGPRWRRFRFPSGALSGSNESRARWPWARSWSGACVGFSDRPHRGIWRCNVSTPTSPRATTSEASSPSSLFLRT